jgi:glutamine---fructose-6-phosphate transaminase (isomerizing)
MCGIVGYIGNRPAYPILISGLKRLEYRGYDSAGIALINGGLHIFKRAGKVSDLEAFVLGEDVTGTIGIGHTRWATHGEPNDTNAHPHLSQSGNITMIHNGIIENYAPLKEGLAQRGYKFTSDTDTEVLVNLIDYIQQQDNLDLLESVRLALNQVVGAYAIVILDKNDPNQLIAARKGSPLVIGIGKDEFFIASDATPIVEHTKNVVYLNDEEIAVLTRSGELNIKTIQNKEKPYSIQELELQIEMLEKGGYEHFMLKEIYEQPNSVLDSMRGRLNVKQGEVVLGGIKDYFQKLVNADRVIIVACGTSWIAGLVGEYLLEDLARINVEVEYASEFRYRNPIITEKDVVIAISQSGETADTLAALELAKAKGATILGICNVVGSSIPRLTHAGVYTHAGPEIGVASTKAFTAQVTVLSLIALALAHKKGSISETRYRELVQELSLIPEKIAQVLKSDAQIKYIAQTFKDVRNFLYLGRGYNFPVALEGALKLKEISYIHAEGYPAAEMKHGPIALIDEEMPVVVLATNMSAYDKIISNIQEVKARKGRVIAIVTEGDEVIKNIAEFTIEIPATEEALTPLLSSIPLQLLAYHIAVLRGCNIDQPRNLAKSVTVE